MTEIKNNGNEEEDFFFFFFQSTNYLIFILLNHLSLINNYQNMSMGHVFHLAVDSYIGRGMPTVLSQSKTC